MAARVSEAEVEAIIEVDSSVDTDTFILAATTLVDAVLADDAYLTTAQLKEVERWLAAHFIAMRQRQARSEGVGDANVVYQVGYLGRGLQYTPYGQQALILDTSGKLAAMGQKRATLTAVDLGL